MRKTFKKLLAMAVVAVMLVSTLVSGLVVSAATPGSLNFEATTTVVEGKDAAVAFKLTFTDPMSALHMLTTITSDLKIADVTLGDVTYVTAPVDPEDPELESPALRIDTKNLDAGKILFESGIAGAVEVTEVNFTVTFDTDALAVGEKTFAIAVESTNYDEANFDAIEMTGAVVVEAAAPECDHANATKVFKEKTTTAFVYACSCECGETWDETLEIGTDFAGTVETKKTINPTNDIAMTFRFASANIGAYSDFIAVITKEVFAKGVAESTTEEAILTTYDTATAGYYSFKFADVAAYEMNNKITCDLYGKSADNVMIKLGSVSNYSVAEYVTSVLTAYATNTSSSVVNLKKALVDLLIYGAKAQTLGKFNEANLVTNVLSSDQLALGTPESEYCGASTVWSELPVAGGVLSGSNDSNKVTVTKTLNPAEKVYLQFTLKTYAADIDSYSVKFNYYDTKGNAQETGILSYAEAGFTKVNNKGEVTGRGFQFDLAPVTTFDYPVTATIYCDGIAVYEEVYSIEAYVKGTYSYATNANASLANVGKFVQSLYAYGRSMATAAKVTPYIDFVK